MTQSHTLQYATSPKHDLPKDDLALRGYTPSKALGHGSQGDVFLAKRDSDGLEVAIKRLNIESVKTWKTYELFHREAEVLSTLAIDGIAKFYEAVDRLEADPPCAYIVQDYIPGMTLDALIRQGHRFSLSYTFDIIVQLLTLLKQLHGHTPPVIHRDIKPSNIMLKPFDKDGDKVYLIDFGAVANPQLQSGGSTVAGTYGFMPPEQLMGKPVPASDVYAVAAVAVNLITGISPADMPVKDFHLIFEPQMQFMPVNVVNILRQMLEPDIENRLCDYDVLIETFTRFRGGNYDTANDILQHSSNAEYEKQLKAVESYAQPGNIELWQRLPDKTPRDMPQIYQELFNTIEKNNIKKKKVKNSHLYFVKKSNIYAHQYTRNKAHYDKEYKLLLKKGEDSTTGVAIWYICMIVYSTIYCVFLLRFETFFNPYYDASISYFVSLFGKSGDIFGYISFMFLLVFPIFVFPILTVFGIKKHLAKSKSLQYDGFERPPEDENKLRNLKRLLIEGRKTIATIVSIQYVEVPYNRIEQNIDTKQCVVHQSPRFEVQYRFNPPDDRDSNDLIHSITMNEPPEDFLKVGEPLPILYRIYRDKNDKEHVDSMPFPIPLMHVDSLSDLQGTSIYSDKSK